MSFKMTADQKAWVAALRSGNYKQGKLELHSAEDDSMCCLGVACNMYLADTKLVVDEDDEELEYDKIYYGSVDDRNYTLAPQSLVDKLGLNDTEGGIVPWPEKVLPVPAAGTGRACISLADLNDAGWSFQQIADFIETYPETVFCKEG